MRLSSKVGWLGLCVVLPLFAFGVGHGQTPAEKKLPVPDKEAEAKAVKLMMLCYAEDLENTREPGAMSLLANDMLKQAKRSKNYEPRDDPANRYVLYREARELAAQAGDADLALAAVDDLAQDFVVNALDLKTAALARVAAAKLNKDTAKNLAERALELLPAAIDADRYDLADSLVKAAQKGAILAKDKALIPVVARSNVEVKVKQKSYAKVEGYIQQLKTNPADAGANLELGKYYALLKGQWDKGLPYLARGSDKALAHQSALDLKRPKDPHERLALADGWWNLAQAEKGKDDSALSVKLQLMRRARHWYREAIVELTGLNHTKARKRIEAVFAVETGGDYSSGPVGEIKKLLGHTDDVKSVAFSADGRFGVSGSNDQTVRIWDLVGGKEERVLRGHKKQVWSVCFRDVNREVLSASWDATARLWDARAGSEIRVFNHRQDVNGLSLSRDGAYLLTACDDHGVNLWNVATGEQQRRYAGHTDFVYCVSFSPDSRYFASGSVDKTMRLTEVNSGMGLRVFDHKASVTNVAFAPDGRTLFSCGDKAAHHWDIDSGKELRSFDHKTKMDEQSLVFALALSSDGRRLCTGGEDRIIRVWEVASGKLLHRLEGHTETITSLAFSPDGNRLLSGSLDRTVRLWNVPAR